MYLSSKINAYHVEKWYKNHSQSRILYENFSVRIYFFCLLCRQYCLSHLYSIIGNNEYMSILKGGVYSLISYAPLWSTMKKVGASTYTLQVKGGISSSTIRRLKAGESVSTNTLDALCKILHCSVQDIIEFIPE